MATDWKKRVEEVLPCDAGIHNCPEHKRDKVLALLHEFAEEAAVVVQKHIDEAGPDESCLYEIRDAIRSMLPKKEDTPDGD